MLLSLLRTKTNARIAIAMATVLLWFGCATAFEHSDDLDAMRTVAAGASALPVSAHHGAAKPDTDCVACLWQQACGASPAHVVKINFAYAYVASSSAALPHSPSLRSVSTATLRGPPIPAA